MTEQELIEARELVAYFRGRRLLPDIDTPLPFRDQIPVLPKMLDSLLKAIDERDAIIHDLQQDGEAMHERIRQAERCEVVNCLRYLLQRKRRQKKAVDLYDIETQIIGCRGLVGNLLPPDQARAECERLRAKLRAIGEQIGVFLDVFTHYQEQWPGLEPAMMVLRRMASEDTP